MAHKIRRPRETLHRTHPRHPTDATFRLVPGSEPPSSPRSSSPPPRSPARLSGPCQCDARSRARGPSRLTLLSAPPGYGKTVAVAAWLASRALATWLSLDLADNDLAQFVRYLVATLRAVRPEVGDATERSSASGSARLSI